ncbi:hypothetical protein FT663_05330 [Candidozyma haemuli var. vulneris]|uniref:CSC1/OSCA1-like 7TM region domain-containing protein n=1 Tax=Candidozyma haemuli TaxID=45357 RepID=A0A2V1AL41_9ASCO|nr:hypothetical protein CXQ85_001331 [[Candida] haemuloni]KAF3985367.1 hypothetical protein FT663_05330 [[Candida] haemuloni var. vulneris]KAF3986573.1 hypothetical protein FT662_04477 [[Candida] haemuloni var. vulneris]PVH19037.1 hypothetical protein CXQ85_001331 [[Candida] haemuloni]
MADDDNQIYGPSQSRVFKTQLVLSLAIGSSMFLLFCFLRRKWPHMYAVRTLRKSSIREKSLPNDLFLWVFSVWSITETDVLECSGLDAYVVLTFFKMGIYIFSLLAFWGVLVLSPVRYIFTGSYDKDNIMLNMFQSDAGSHMDDDFPSYLWVYPLFTWIFSTIVYVKLFDFTTAVIKTRQKYLASQDSITDRTIKLDGIPKKLIRQNDPVRLKHFIEGLGIGHVVDVKLIYDWSPLEKLFDERNELISRLEQLYSRYFGLNIDLYNQSKVPRVIPEHAPELPIASSSRKSHLKEKIDTLAAKLISVDKKISDLQNKYDPRTSTIPIDDDSEFSIMPSAFITMDSVASAQMAAQTVLDPRVYKLMVSMAPAAKDIEWRNLKLSRYEKAFKSYMVTFFIILSYSVIFFLVTSLSTLIDVKTITKVWPALGHKIAESKWLSTFVTGILPPMLFSMINVLIPYFYNYLSRHQGYASSSEVELSALSKNFFFVFFILFVVFTITGTLWDFFTSIGDTTKFASQLASSLKKLSLFYADLILLQGLAMFPVRLLQVGDFFILNIVGKLFLLRDMFLKTPRDYRFFYFTPPVFDFGIQLPQHILIFIIILIYSVVSTKIVACGLVYFLLGHFVYKYQLIYSFVHPPHSTGKVWPMIFRRLMFGLLIFQLFMCGTLALEGAILLSVLCTPLFIVTLLVWWNFEKFYVPLHDFIALRAIQSPHNFDKEFNDDSSSVVANSLRNFSFDGGLNASSDSLTARKPPQVQVPEPEHMTGYPTPCSDDVLSPTETSALLDGDYSISYSAGAIRHRRKVSTVDEEREQFTDYTHPYLRDPLYGPWIGFDGDHISMVEFRKRGGSAEAEENSAEPEQYTGPVSEFVIRKRIQAAEWE